MIILESEAKFEEYLKKNKLPTANIGIFAVGHNSYWPQFPDLKNKLQTHYNYFCENLKKNVNSNIIIYKEICDSFFSAEKAGNYFVDKKIDLAICYLTTYSPGSIAATVLKKIKNAGVILIGMQPFERLDYEKGTTVLQLENDNIVSLPEIINSLERMNIKALDCVVGYLYDDDRSWGKIKKWCEVANVYNKLNNDHIGALGHTYEGMLDMNSDPTMFEGPFGAHIEHLEMEDLEFLVNSVSDKEINNKIKEILELFELPNPKYDPITSKVTKEDIIWPAKVSVGMDKLVYDYKLTGLAYYYRGLNNNFEKLHAGMIIGNSLLTSKGISISGEYDIKNSIAMLITDRFGAGGSFAEIHPIDFIEDFVLVGHDGPHHLMIAEGKPVLRKLSVLHGKRGFGPSVEYKIKTGPITMLGLTQNSENKFKFVVAEGESLPGLIPATGNTNTRVRFKPDIRTFLEKWSMEGPTHHISLGIGHLSEKIEMLSKWLKIEIVNVTK
jgi:L-arabinose isomerase